MNTPSVKEQLIAKLDQLTDDELADLLEYIEIMQYTKVMNSMTLPDDYSIENDGLVGFLSGTTDLAERIEDILYGESEIEQSLQETK